MRKQSHKAPSPINCAACACIASSSACPKVSATRSPTSASESPCSLPGFTIVSCALAHPLAGSPVTRNAEIDPPPRLRCSDSEIQCGPVVALGCRTEMPAFTESFGIYYHDLEQRNRPVKRAGDRPFGRASRPGLCRSGRLDCAPRPAWPGVRQAIFISKATQTYPGRSPLRPQRPQSLTVDSHRLKQRRVGPL
jgi:hypothetical protein